MDWGTSASAIIVCHRRGWAVPDRLAIAGFGDFEIADQIAPALTTVRVPRYKNGMDAARLILDGLAGKIDASVALDLGFAGSDAAAHKHSVLLGKSPLRVEVNEDLHGCDFPYLFFMSGPKE